MDYTILDSINRLRHRSNLILGLVFLAIGVVALGLAVVQLASTAMLFSRTKGATGRYVESVDRRAVFNGGTFQHARFQFRSADGKIRYATASDGSTQQSYAIGDTASIRYEPAAPDHAMVCSFLTLWTGPLFCGAFAFAFGLPGLTVLMRERSARRLRNTTALERFPNLAAYVARGEARPAHRRAMADHLALYERVDAA